MRSCNTERGTGMHRQAVSRRKKRKRVRDRTRKGKKLQLQRCSLSRLKGGAERSAYVGRKVLSCLSVSGEEVVQQAHLIFERSCVAALPPLFLSHLSASSPTLSAALDSTTAPFPFHLSTSSNNPHLSIMSSALPPLTLFSARVWCAPSPFT